MNELKRCVQALAAPFETQVTLFPSFVVVADELALDFEEAMRGFRKSGESTTEAQQRSLEALDSRITELSGPQNAEFWGRDALQADPRWDGIRSLAANVLVAFDWPREEPPKNAAIYVNARSVVRND